jgi:hypothetical protein
VTLRLTAALAVLALAAGCHGNSKLPKTYPVSGKVVYADGTAVNGGLVQFVPERNAAGTTTGLIQPDGSFTLRTVVDNEDVSGAVEGPHTVTILPPLEQDQRAPRGLPPQPIQLREPVTVKADGPNTFTLTLPRG